MNFLFIFCHNVDTEGIDKKVKSLRKKKKKMKSSLDNKENNPL